MKRLVVALVPLFLFAACRQESLLPSNEVLKRAASASQELVSARYRANVKFSGEKSDVIAGKGAVTLDGRLQEGGGQTQFTLDLKGEIRMPGVPSSAVSANLDIAVIGPDEIYLRVNAIESAPLLSLLSTPVLREFEGQWWQLRENDRRQAASEVTPDPRLLRAQSQVVRVARDRGIERYDNRDVYHYDVVFDQEKFADFLETMNRFRNPLHPDEENNDPSAVAMAISGIEAEGSLWIDAETFVLRRVEWNVSVKTGEADFLNVSLRVHFSDHGQAPPITPPQGAKRFVPSVTMQNPRLVSPAGDGGESEPLPREVEQEILDALLEEPR